MEELIHNLVGEGQHLTPLQMSVRAFFMFFIILVLIKLGGIRIFGKQTAFDAIVRITLGAVLARGIVGASPYFSTVVACTVIILLHRLFGRLAIKNHFIGKIVKGESVLLYKNGEFYWKNMRKTSISKNDILESLRLELNCETLQNVEAVYIERTGQITFITKDKNQI